jgi:hypothetical protein
MWTLIASFFWGTIGFALLVYGKKADEMIPLVIGLILMVISYFLSALWLTLISIALLAFYVWHIKSS